MDELDIEKRLSVIETQLIGNKSDVKKIENTIVDSIKELQRNNDAGFKSIRNDIKELFNKYEMVNISLVTVKTKVTLLETTVKNCGNDRKECEGKEEKKLNSIKAQSNRMLWGLVLIIITLLGTFTISTFISNIKNNAVVEVITSK